ncbi:SLC28A3 (predicted) [Pycnogonum litorale]
MVVGIDGANDTDDKPPATVALDVQNDDDIKRFEEDSSEKNSSKISTDAIYDNPAFSDDLPAESNGHSYDVNQTDARVVDDSDEGGEQDGCLSRFSAKLQNDVDIVWTKHKGLVRKTIFVLALVAFYVYLGYAIFYDWYRTNDWCNGVRFLVLITIIVHLTICYQLVLRNYINKIWEQSEKKVSSIWQKRFVRWGLYVALVAAVVIFLIIDTSDDRRRLISASGVLVITAFGFIFSTNPSKVRWRPVLWGLSLQFIFALIILRWDVGRQVFDCIGNKVKTFLDFTDEGTSFVYSYLVTGELKSDKNVKVPEQYAIFAFKVLPVIIFFNFCTAILYYLGVMQVVVKKVGWLLQVTVGTTIAESMNAAGNIFLGQSEAPLMIAPFLNDMTLSEMHAVMTGGFATIAGTVLAAYINFGISASHLLSASVMSAPAALGISKLFYPETEKSKTDFKTIKDVKSTDQNVLEAASRGASQSVDMISNIIANLIAFLAFIKFIDTLLSWFGSLVGYPSLGFEIILSKLFFPLALIMGVELEDAEKVATLLGLKTIVNEFVAYARLGEMIKGNQLSPRSEVIATYALCGFSNLSSIGIQIGVLSSLAPSRRSDWSKIALRAMIAGSLACFLTACVAGSLIAETSGQFQDVATTTAINNMTTVLNNATTGITP